MTSSVVTNREDAQERHKRNSSFVYSCLGDFVVWSSGFNAAKRRVASNDNGKVIRAEEHEQ